MIDFLVVLAAHGDTKDQTVVSLFNCYERLPEKFGVTYLKGDALIGRVRSVGASQFLKEHLAEYMIFVDTDIQFTPDELEKIYLAMREGYDIVAGVYGLGSGDKFAIQGIDGRVTFDGKVHPCKYVSTGFMGISRNALLTIRDKLALPLLHEGDAKWECWPFFESGAFPEEKIYISEDWDFCNKARKAGLTVSVHTGVMVDHVKEYTVVAEGVLEKVRIQPSTINAGDSLIPDLAVFLDKPMAEVREQVINCHEFMKSEAERKPDDWLFDLVQFNSYDYYPQQRLAPLDNLAGHNVLDYGCGIGTAAMHLSVRNKVTAYDKNPKAIDFAKFRMAKHGFMNVSFTTEEPDVSKFDTILFIDVLEHFEDLRTFMVGLGAKVKRGTKIYHYNAFKHKIPAHYDHTDEWASILSEAGFIPFSTLWSIKE